VIEAGIKEKAAIEAELAKAMSRCLSHLGVAARGSLSSEEVERTKYEAMALAKRLEELGRVRHAEELRSTVGRMAGGSQPHIQRVQAVEVDQGSSREESSAATKNRPPGLVLPDRQQLKTRENLPAPPLVSPTPSLYPANAHNALRNSFQTGRQSVLGSETEAVNASKAVVDRIHRSFSLPPMDASTLRGFQDDLVAWGIDGMAEMGGEEEAELSTVVELSEPPSNLGVKIRFDHAEDKMVLFKNINDLELDLDLNSSMRSQEEGDNEVHVSTLLAPTTQNSNHGPNSKVNRIQRASLRRRGAVKDQTPAAIVNTPAVVANKEPVREEAARELRRSMSQVTHVEMRKPLPRRLPGRGVHAVLNKMKGVTRPPPPPQQPQKPPHEHMNLPEVKSDPLSRSPFTSLYS